MDIKDIMGVAAVTVRGIEAVPLAMLVACTSKIGQRMQVVTI